MGVDALIIIKSAEDIDGIIAGNALAKIAADPSRLLIAMTNDGKLLGALQTLAKTEWGAEKVHLGKHAAYVWCANGILDSKAAASLLKGLAGAGTTRNWATLNKIHALMGKGAQDER